MSIAALTAIARFVHINLAKIRKRFSNNGQIEICLRNKNAHIVIILTQNPNVRIHIVQPHATWNLHLNHSVMVIELLALLSLETYEKCRFAAISILFAELICSQLI